MTTVIVATHREHADNYCRREGIDPRARDTLIVSDAKQLRGYALRREDVHFVGAVEMRHDYLEICNNLDAAYAKDEKA